MKKKLLFIAIASALISSPAMAGEWCRGYGETPKEAMDSARQSAKDYVKSRGGRGCVSGKARYVGKEGGLYVMEILAHNQNGSCGKDSNEEEMIKKALGQ